MLGVRNTETSKGRLSPVVKQAFVSAAVCMNVVGIGSSVGIMAVLLPQLEKPDSIIPLDAESNSWLTAMSVLPFLIGNFLMAAIMGRIGRKPSHIIVTVTGIIGWLLAVVAKDFMMLVWSRLLLGLSFGASLSLRATLIAECTSPRYRGSFLMAISLAQGFGIFFVHLVGSIIDWQKTSFVCMMIHFISLVMTLYIPETPSFLASKGKIEECREAFRWLRGDEEDELEELITARFAPEESKSISVLETVKKREFHKPVFISIHLNGLMQLAGGPTMAAYSLFIIGLIVGPSVNAAFWMIFLDAQRIITNTIAVYVIPKFKRRTMLFSIGSICVISHLAIAVYVYAKNNGLSYISPWLPLLIINVQIFTVATGMVPLPNVICGEIFPFQYRGIGNGIGIFFSSLYSFVVLKTFLSLSLSIGIEGIYTAYAIALTYFLVVLWFILPETRGKTLEKIEEEFRGVPSKKQRETAPLKQKYEEDEKELAEIVRRQSVISRHSLANGVLI